MASREINDFTAKSTVTATDEYLLQETGGGTTKKTLISTIRDYILGYITSLTGKTTPVDNDVILINDSADSNNPKKVTLTDLSDYMMSNTTLPADFVGLALSNDADTDHDINVTAGRCCDSTKAYTLTLSSELTKQIDASWVAGDDAGGLDTGTVAADTWYYIFAIRKDSDGSTDILISASATSPTMPTGYTYFRRLRGAVLTDGSANVLDFYQKDNRFWFVDRIQEVNTASNVTTRIITTVSVPPNMIGMLWTQISDSATNNLLIGSIEESDTVPTTSNNDCIATAGSNQGQIAFEAKVDSSSQIYYRMSASSSQFRISTRGFIDNAEL